MPDVCSITLATPWNICKSYIVYIVDSYQSGDGGRRYPVPGVRTRFKRTRLRRISFLNFCPAFADIIQDLVSAGTQNNEITIDTINNLEGKWIVFIIRFYWLKK